MAIIRQVTLDKFFTNDELLNLIEKRQKLEVKRNEVPKYMIPLVNDKIDNIDVKIIEKANLYVPTPILSRRIVSNYIKDMEGVI